MSHILMWNWNYAFHNMHYSTSHKVINEFSDRFSRDLSYTNPTPPDHTFSMYSNIQMIHAYLFTTPPKMLLHLTNFLGVIHIPTLISNL